MPPTPGPGADPGATPRTLAEIPAHAARLAGDRPGIVTTAGRHSFADLRRDEEAVARGLLLQGLAPRDRVAVLLPNDVTYLHAFYGIALAGGVIVPVNTFLVPVEVTAILEDSGASILITTARRLAALAPSRRRLPRLRVAIVVPGEEGGEAHAAEGIRIVPWREIAAPPGAPPALPPPPGREEIAVLSYTSGTTGRMKGVMLTHASLLANARACLEAVKLRRGDRLLLFLPMFHSLTQMVCMVVPPIAGLPVVLLPAIDRAAIRDALRRHRPTIFVAVPAVYAAMAEHPPNRLVRWLNPVRLYICGGAPLPNQVLRRFEAVWGRPLCEGYGLSEAAPVVSFNPVDGVRKGGSVGLPLAGVEIRIRGDDGAVRPTGEVGEITLRGPNVMAGYHDRPEETAAALRDGWLHTGDLGYVDAEGYLFIVGRRKEMLIFRGLNIYPREVEEALAGHPAVAEAAVVGLADPHRGEVPHAAVSLRPGAAAAEHDLRLFCRERLARYKVPRSILVMSSLPRNATGKVMKESVRAAIAEARAAAINPPEEEPAPTDAAASPSRRAGR